jgi:hypothetical protein
MPSQCQIIGELYGCMADRTLRRATAYLDPDCTIKLTRQSRPDPRGPSETYILTVGRPNYAEREFIAHCREAREPFPVKKFQMQNFPEKSRA